MPYTGKKLRNYIWIPKPKSDLKEYRDFLRICRIVQEKKGFFNDKSVGKALVKSGSIFDGSLSPDDYFEKYGDLSIGNQSYVSNARMSIRMCRFWGWITRVNGARSEFRLTPRGMLLSNFIGKFPNETRGFKEFDIMLYDIINMRFYCVNDSLQFQNKKFKQRIMVNILRFLERYDFLHNYEIVASALTMRNESKSEIDKAFDRLERLRNMSISISDLFDELQIDAQEKSSMTGVYDGPKVLCSFLKQLNLLEPINTKSLGKSVIDYYNKVYVGSPFLKGFPRNVFQITGFGRSVLKEKLNDIPVWYEDLPKPKQKFAALLCALKFGRELNQVLSDLKLRLGDFKRFIGDIDNSISISEFITRSVFDYYRDMPPEEYDNFEEIMAEIIKEPLFYDIDMDKSILLPKKYLKRKTTNCILCYPYRCMNYPEFNNTPNSSDYLAYKLCPVDAITVKNKKNVSLDIDYDKCAMCLLCMIKCPISAIYLDGNVLKIRQPDFLDNNYEKVKGKEDDLISIVSKFISDNGLPNKVDIPDRVAIVKYFETKISKLGDSWDQDPFYVWTRNCFRALGLEVSYTGGRGMKTRSDVTITSPFPVAIEVKSPSEGKVAGKAIRQTDDAAAQLFQKFQRKVYMCCVGQEITSPTPHPPQRPKERLMSTKNIGKVKVQQTIASR